jgi:hypothetical protein
VDAITKQIEMEAEQRLTTTKELVLATIEKEMDEFAELEGRMLKRWEIIEKLWRARSAKHRSNRTGQRNHNKKIRT